MFISSDGGNTWRQVTGRFGGREEPFRASSANIFLIDSQACYDFLGAKKLKQLFYLVNVAGRLDGQWEELGRA